MIGMGRASVCRPKVTGEIIVRMRAQQLSIIENPNFTTTNYWIREVESARIVIYE